MNKIINIQVTRKAPIEVIHYVQFSTEISIEFNLSDYLIPEGATARFYLLKPSGHEVYNECLIADNRVILEPTAQTFAEHGKQKGQIQIIVGEKPLVSFILEFDVEKNLISESAIESTDEFGALDSLIIQAQGSIARANAGADSANAAADRVDGAIEAAAVATANANEATDLANTSAENAEAATALANTATADANAATADANAAAELANEAAQEIIDGRLEARVSVLETNPEVDTLSVAGVDHTITETEFDELMALINSVGGGEDI